MTTLLLHFPVVRLTLRTIVCCFAFAGGIGICSAQALLITPTLELTPANAQHRLEAPKSGNITIEGAGAELLLTYSSPVPMDFDIAPLRGTSGVDPSEMMHFSVPAANSEMQAKIDLTPSPGWTPFMQKYYLAFYGPKEAEASEITNAEFLPASFGTTLAAALLHLSIRELYQVATYHALRGTTVIGLPFTLFLALPTLIIACIAFIVSGKLQKLQRIFLIFILGIFAYGAWFGIDLLHFTIAHAHEWLTRGTYAEAGAITQVADAIYRDFHKPAPAFTYVCTDSTDFAAKILRYHLFPIPVSTNVEDLPHATHIVVLAKLGWTYTDGTLHCGRIEGKAEKVTDFPDGSALFRIPRAP